MNNIEVDGIPLNQFSSLVFGLFAYARSPQAQTRVLFDPAEILGITDFPKDVRMMISGMGQNVGEMDPQKARVGA